MVVLSIEEGVKGVQQEGAQGKADRDCGQYVEEGGLGIGHLGLSVLFHVEPPSRGAECL